MNLSQAEIRNQMEIILADISFDNFRIRDFKKHKICTMSNGSINKYINASIENGTIEVVSGELGQTKEPRIFKLKSIKEEIINTNTTQDITDIISIRQMAIEGLNHFKEEKFDAKTYFNFLKEQYPSSDFKYTSLQTILSRLSIENIITRVGLGLYSTKPNADKTFNNVIKRNLKETLSQLVMRFAKQKSVDTFTKKYLFECINDGTVHKASLDSTVYKLTADNKLDKLIRGVYRLNKQYTADTKPTISTKVFNPETCPIKYKISQYQYWKVKRYVQGDTLILCGPNVEKHIKLTKDIVKDNHQLNLIDNDITTFKIIADKMDKIKQPKNINYMFGSVADVSLHTPFQDLDFCSTWIGKDQQENEAGQILGKRLIIQSQMKYPTSAMLFTFSCRKFKKSDIFRFLNNIINNLGAFLNGFDGIKNSYDIGKNILSEKQDWGYGYRHDPDWILKGRIKELDFYTYRDSGNHMMSCLIIYK